ncbi:hypothetical protein [Bradyrhizobium elkanii]|uniref:hypothetical protein n=1 Tax=Bradyrhizobium elkanii TaxID=29448 RepID=UPI00272CC3D2|nr:hypothetical protein [Bradyrhizobium elkanii]WLA80260.1 hypothetical protein QNJ99_33470 [Bradyrhizobium elkanii]
MERTVTFDDEVWQLVPRKPTPEMLGKAISSTSSWLNLSGSAMTVNYKKASIRYRAMLSVAPCPYDLPRSWDREFEMALAERAQIYRAAAHSEIKTGHAVGNEFPNGDTLPSS